MNLGNVIVGAVLILISPLVFVHYRLFLHLRQWVGLVCASACNVYQGQALFSPPCAISQEPGYEANVHLTIFFFTIFMNY